MKLITRLINLILKLEKKSKESNKRVEDLAYNKFCKLMETVKKLSIPARQKYYASSPKSYKRYVLEFGNPDLIKGEFEK